MEDRLDELARTGGVGRIRTLLAQLDVIAGTLSARPVELSGHGWAELLGTITGSTPASARLAAGLQGEPFDAHRLELLTALVTTLGRTAPLPRPALGDSWTEGTEFGVDEARRTAVEGGLSAARPQDAHDVAATYRLVVDAELSRQTPDSGAELMDLLRARHAVLMAARPDKRPGEFKAQDNYVGGYRFVEPDLLIGSLRRGFEALGSLTDPLHRAIGMMFLITECHPFDDGMGGSLGCWPMQS